MRKKTIGEVLKLSRIERGWSLEKVQRMVNIQAKHLQAIEENDFEAIGDEGYVQSFIERYAEIVELDADILLDAYHRNTLIAYYTVGEEPDATSDFRRAKKTPQKKYSYLPLLYLLLASTAILIFVSYIVSTRVKNQARIKTEPSYSVVTKTSTKEEKTSSSEEEKTDEEKPKEEETATQLTVTGADPSLSVHVAGAPKPVEVILSVTDATSWVSLTDTELANGATLSPENKTVTVTIPEGLTETTLTLGVVAGVDIKVAGKTVDTSALTSQTGYITFTIE